MPSEQADVPWRLNGVRKAVNVAAVVVAALMGAASISTAVPPPAPNPSDSEIGSGRRAAEAGAAEVGRLASQLAENQARLVALQDEVELKLEDANKALVDLQSAESATRQARLDAESSRRTAESAAGSVELARRKLNQFAAASFEQGSTVGSVSAYLTADSPRDLLARARLLNAIGADRLNALQGMQRAQVEKGNKDAESRQAFQLAQQRQAEAAKAKTAAAAAQAAAARAQQGQESRAAQLRADQAAAEQRLYDAQSKLAGLRGQRQRYQDWQAQKQQEDNERARRAAMAASGNRNDPPAVRLPSALPGATVTAVIARALSQVGVPYAWGGGNASGPTLGIRDGGVADSFGDYRKTGFDCSGLLIYAFAGVRPLPHYSGYQYDLGRKVPLSQMRPGDLLAWSTAGRIHHIALYLGNGQMVEAQQSGTLVKVSPVRFGGIKPYASRLID